MEKESVRQDIRERKYNLILHGIKGAEKEAEKTEVTVRAMAKEEMKMANIDVNNLQITSVYLINSSLVNSNGKPNPIILRYGRWTDREKFQLAAKNLDQTKNIKVMTDLPIHLSKKRAKLARIAYDIRKQEKKWTRIRLVDTEIILEIKGGQDQSWTKHEAQNNEL